MDWGSIFEGAIRAAFDLDAVVFAIAAIGLNIHFGYTGLLNFGQVGFMAAGAYGVGIATTYFGWNPWVALVVGILAAVVLALILGLPTLRLRADYLAIVTIATSEILRLSFRSVSLREFSGGSNGINGFANAFYAWSPFDPQVQYGIRIPGIDLSIKFFGNRAWILLIGWIVVVALLIFVRLAVSSPWGRVLKAIREDEDAVRALGKNAYWFKVQSLIVGGVIGAIGGMVLSIGTQTVQPDVYSTSLTFFVWTALILGGVGRTWSPVIGAMIFWVLLSFTEGVLRQGVENNYLPDWLIDGVQVGQVRFIMVGLGLCALLIFRPQGIFGDRNEMALEDR
ncbi:MAG: branched-chain amino acid ABC transporter permease [Actinobacteria bacterium]|nr:branched-chain amino acid ABC transporter permease [Actinomycetota bacterium]MCB9389983.1 branched-chain amino acid ABC transporter permease [Acidimicrobiia bacterium]